MQRSTLGRRRRRGLQAAAISGALVVMSLALAGPSAAQSDQLEVDEISHSKNMELVLNIPRQGPGTGFTHSDLAFWGNYAFQGHYGGFNVYDIKQPQKTQLITQVACPGSQGDVTVSPDGTLLFVSVDASRSDDSCMSTSQSAANPDSWEGIRIFDITDIENPVYVKSVETDCGSHTHTLVPDPDTDDTLYLYISSYGPSVNFPDCQPPHDYISIVEVPVDDPTAAFVVNKPKLPPEGVGNFGGCHDITVFPEDDLAAGACRGDGILFDISDPVNPYVIDGVRDSNFAFWHSATLVNDGTGVIFTDELGGGGAPTCNEAIGPVRGADAIYDIVGEGDDRELVFRSYYKIPRHQQNTENCVAHNGMLIPVKGQAIFVQSWYQGGVSVFDFGDRDNPVEIAYFERGPLSATNLVGGGSWSAYWYNGYIYSSDLVKGLDVLKITGHEGISSANNLRLPYLNPQTQFSYKDIGAS